MSFNVAADSYDRFMGRYSVPLAPQFADFASVAGGQRVLDVGCGPGALTGELIRRVDPRHINAVDPSDTFVGAARERYPAVTVQRAAAEQLPFDDDTFDVALAQLVVHFMADPVAGLREMGRVTRQLGTVAACVWDLEGGKAPLSVFWEAARELEPDVRTEAGMAGAREGHLAKLFNEAGLRDVVDSKLSISVEHQSFDDWWQPYTLGVGPAGKYAAGLDPGRLERLRELCRDRLPTAPFKMTAQAWAARGSV
ncbi:MAG: class I SAM-dependent methyltransferase [Ilumatobacteraceae bacterium]